MFTYIEQGDADFILDGIKYQLHAGDALIMPPFMLHLIHATSVTPLIQYIVHFDLMSNVQRRKWQEISITLPEQNVLPDSEKSLLFIDPISHINSNDQLYLKRRFLTLQQLYSSTIPFSDVQMKGILTELLAIFFRNQTETPIQLSKQSKGWASIELSIHYIYSNYARNELDRMSIAEHVGLSPNHLSHLFKEQLGISIHKFVSSIRIEQAKKKILEGKHTLTTISEQVGFTSIYSFSRAFKSMVGTSASQFHSLHTSQSHESILNRTIANQEVNKKL
ncbi:helix-turn-helix transcriptional regulator [Paenibacillus endoradicis]|uniref:helix-turn-helix transcriptional regulator n=1 Tax=Paenibacillus endoradicis TaxID=2972487 RepID=UPI002159A72F|nr:AraC family transcriptional regulator [Paenibacillus endoradicis]MCR8659939.1 AraC family transcriptional regulator [Paenibacillus endoradicis]